MRNQIIEELAEKLGSFQAIADLLGISKSAVSQWTKVPWEHARKLEAKTGISRSKICPDVFGEDAVENAPAK